MPENWSPAEAASAPIASMNVAVGARALAPDMSSPRAAYIHVPFCAHRCGYCNFTLVAGRDDLIDTYLRALEIELSWLGEPRPVSTLFLGGGTPTHLPPEQLDRLLELATRWFPPNAEAEFSVEANPADMDAERSRVLAARGVNRVSIGAQSFNPAKLRHLERDHGPDDIRRAVDQARRFARSVSLDLIFAAPGETLPAWQADLEAAIALAPDHLSTYGLTFERGTSFFSRLAHGQLLECDEETQRGMYLAAIDRLSAAGFEHYEVSNFARPNHRCRHNEVYWAGESYFAAGPGAARYVGGVREVNHRSTTTYLARVEGGQSPVAHGERLSPEDRAREALVLAMRRIAGVQRESFARQFGYSVDDLAGRELKQFAELGLVADDGSRVQLTRNGLLVSDSLWPAILRQ